jgi:predicted transcriptional regulator
VVFSLCATKGGFAMSTTIKVDLPEETKAALDVAVREEGMSEGALIEKAVKDYLFVRQFRSLRERMMSQAGKTLTDQDVFDLVS